MFRKVFPILMLFCFIQIATSQSKETCDTPKTEAVLDLNSITKCSIEKPKNENSKANKVAVEVTSRRRVVRKRDAATGVMTNDYTHKLADIKKKAKIINNLNLEKSGGLKIIPFDYVDEVPLFKNCESVAIYKQEKCFKQELASHIKKNLRYPEKAYDNGVQGRVFVHFIIDNKGNVGKMKIVAPYKGEELGKEAERIMKKLPKFKPGKHEGSAITVKYGLPITFRIPGVKPSNLKRASKKVNVSKVYDFENVETIPQFTSCNASGDTSINCFNKNLVTHIEDNFAYPTEAINQNIEGKIFVRFMINAEGEVINISAKGPENGQLLEKAAKELVEKLPKFVPAKKNGKSVNTRYSFPVAFTLN